MSRPAVSAVVLACTDAVAIAALRSDPARVVHHVGSPHRWLAEVGTDTALATLAGAGLWCAAVLVGLGLLATAAVRLPGTAGRAAARVSRILLPRVLHRMLVGSAGLGVFLAPVAAGAHAIAASPTPGPRASGDVTTSSVPVPAWPLDGPAPTSSAPGSVPAPLWPSTEPPARPVDSPHASAPPHGTAAPRASPPPHASPSLHGTAPPHASPSLHGTAPPHASEPTPAQPAERAAVTVAPGDSLWLIAARRLGPDATPSQITDAWPRWYSANRTVIGGDPALIVPGQVLHQPAPNSEEAPA